MAARATPAQQRALDTLHDEHLRTVEGWATIAAPLERVDVDTGELSDVSPITWQTALALERRGLAEIRDDGRDEHGMLVGSVRAWDGEGAPPARRAGAAPAEVRESETERRVPREAVDLAEVARRFPAVRQSTLSSFDDCALSALWEIENDDGYSTAPQARGTILHRVFAECMRTMAANDSQGIPVGEALAILDEILLQRDVEPRERVRLPLSEMPAVEMAVVKWATDNQFAIRNVVAIEERLQAPLAYDGPDGRPIERTLSGTPDLLIARDGGKQIVVVDWKTGWSLPPRRDEDADNPGVSYGGFFQQQFYAWLVMQAYPSVEAVTLREFYVYRTQARAARLWRKDLPTVERRLRFLLAAFDGAVAAGQPPRPLTLRALERHGAWQPSPGAHCSNCPMASSCPIASERREGAMDREEAERLAGVRRVAKATIERLDKHLRPYAQEHGPIAVKRAKGRLALGFQGFAEGKRTKFTEFTPTGADRPATEDAEQPSRAEPRDTQPLGEAGS